MVTPALDPGGAARYGRQLVLPQVGMPGQARLARSRVLVVGAGGLGSPALLYLAAAGVGTVGVVDDDDVDVTNLHRQVVHAADAVGLPKTRSARESIGRLNPRTAVVEHRERLRSDNAVDILAGYDVVVDGSDNFATRYVVSDACVALGLAHVWGCVVGFEGQVAVWRAGDGPCYRCVFPDRSSLATLPSCEQAGVLGSVCAVIGSVQATETLKLLLGVGEPLVGRLLIHDGLRQTWDIVPVRADRACPACGDHSRAPSPTEPASPSGMPVEAVPRPGPSLPAPLEPAALAAYLAGSDAVLVDVRDEVERAAVTIPGAVPVPLGQFHTGTAFSRPELADPARPVVVFCTSGSRSEEAVRLGRRAGYSRMTSLRGGVLGWLRVDVPDLPAP